MNGARKRAGDLLSQASPAATPGDDQVARAVAQVGISARAVTQEGKDGEQHECAAEIHVQHAREAEQERLEAMSRKPINGRQAEQVDGDPEGEQQGQDCGGDDKGEKHCGQQVDGLAPLVAQEALDACAHVVDLGGGCRVAGVAPQVVSHAQPHGGDAGMIALEGGD